MKTATYSNEYFPVAPVFPASIAIPGESPTGNEMSVTKSGWSSWSTFRQF